MGISLKYLFFSLIFLPPHWHIINLTIFISILFSLVVRLIICQVLILSKMRAIEVIHSIMWTIIVAFFSLFVWGLCNHISLKNKILSIWLIINFEQSLILKWSLSTHIKQTQIFIGNLLLKSYSLLEIYKIPVLE